MVRRTGALSLWALTWLAAVACGGSSSSAHEGSGGDGAGGAAPTANPDDDCPCPAQTGGDPYVGSLACTFPAGMPSCANTTHEQLAFLAARAGGGTVFTGCGFTQTRIDLDGLNELACAYAADGSFVAALRDD